MTDFAIEFAELIQQAMATVQRAQDEIRSLRTQVGIRDLRLMDAKKKLDERIEMDFDRIRELRAEVELQRLRIAQLKVQLSETPGNQAEVDELVTENAQLKSLVAMHSADNAAKSERIAALYAALSETRLQQEEDGIPCS